MAQFTTFHPPSCSFPNTCRSNRADTAIDVKIGGTSYSEARIQIRLSSPNIAPMTGGPCGRVVAVADRNTSRLVKAVVYATREHSRRPRVPGSVCSSSPNPEYIPESPYTPLNVRRIDPLSARMLLTKWEQARLKSIGLLELAHRTASGRSAPSRCSCPAMTSRSIRLAKAHAADLSSKNQNSVGSHSSAKLAFER